MAGNITVKAGTTTLGVLSISSNINGQPQFFPPNFGILYKYANLTLPYSPNDPGLTYTFDNTNNLPHVNLAARFFNLLNEPSTAFPFDAGTAGAVAVSGTAVSAPPCLNVLNFGAVGDGITNDTAAIQCALDQAARNWNAQQSALAQKQRLTNPGSTIVCIPSGYTFAVGGNFWASTCGRAWGTNGNWPVNPYDVAMANYPWYDTFFGKSGTAGRNLDAALFVRSGVTVQLDGTLLRIEPQSFGAFESTTVLCIADDQVANYQASAVTIRGIGTIDGNGQPFLTLGESALGGPSGNCIYALVSQTLTIQGITLKSALRWGIELYTGTTVWPVFLGSYNAPVAPTVYTDAPLSNTTIQNVTLQNCGLFSLSNGHSLIGGIQIAGSQVSVTGCTFNQCQVGVWFNGKQITVSSNTFNNCAGNVDSNGLFLNTGQGASVIIVGLSNTCAVKNNTIQGGGSYLLSAGGPWVDSQGGALPPTAGGSGAAIRILINTTPLKIKKASDIPSPMYPVDYLYNVAITGNSIATFYGRGIWTDELITRIPAGIVLGFYSLLRIDSNNIDGCTGFGIYYEPTIWPYVQPCGTLFPDGLNYGCTILDDNFGTNGLGEGVSITYVNQAQSTKYTSVNNPIPLFYGLCQQLAIGAQAFGPTTLTKMTPLTACCIVAPDSSIFGPYMAFPYYGLSYGGFGTALSDARGALAVSSGSSQNFPLLQIVNETPGGNVDGSNKTFTLRNAPFPKASVQVVQTGTTNLSVSSGTITPTNFISSSFLTGYSISGNVITFGSAPPSGSSLAVSYTYLPPQPQ